MIDFKETVYSLVNLETDRVFKDSGWDNSDPLYSEPTLIRSLYANKQLELKGDKYGLYTFCDWLPVNKILQDSAPTITYKSERLAAHLGLSDLNISFSGYWPEKGANMTTASFKETEAFSVCGRLPKDNKKVLVVASAGNTARAFAKVCSKNNIPLLLFVPEDNINALWFNEKINDCVKLISTPKGSDYFDAIHLSSIVCSGSDMFLEEGGAKNVARRDGMGTTVLSCATTIGRIPDAYFQAIGSGTGVIAAWEANLRLIRDGRFGNNKMKLFPSQNSPFTPMYDAWQETSRSLFEMDAQEARKLALQIEAKVLSNRKPPYSIRGGVFDALMDTDGAMEKITNQEVLKQCECFKQLEGIDINPAAAVALQGMINSIESGKVKKDDCLMLNITGGGEELFKSHYEICYLEPSLIISPEEDQDSIIERAEALFI